MTSAVRAIRKPSAAINGFGRFGLGLFRAWFDDSDPSYTIAFVNDDVLGIDRIAAILRSDPIVTTFHGLKVNYQGNVLRIYRRNGSIVEMTVTTGPIESSGWIGSPAVIFDCSSRASNFTKYADFLSGDTRVVLIGATTAAANSTLIMGFNETEYDVNSDVIISFGSCTVIPGIHVIDLIQSKFGLRSVLINVVHSVPKWQLDAGRWRSLVRKDCTLERVAPSLITSLSPEMIKVNYTYAPYYGVSLMDFTFVLGHPVSRDEFIADSRKGIGQVQRRKIIGIEPEDYGAEQYADSKQSITIIESSVDVRREIVHFFGYFNNEGSGIRLHELANFITFSWLK